MPNYIKMMNADVTSREKALADHPYDVMILCFRNISVNHALINH